MRSAILILSFPFKKFNYKNVNEVPKLEKVVLNMGLGDVKDNSKSLQLLVEGIYLFKNIFK